MGVYLFSVGMRHESQFAPATVRLWLAVANSSLNRRRSSSSPSRTPSVKPVCQHPTSGDEGSDADADSDPDSAPAPVPTEVTVAPSSRRRATNGRAELCAAKTSSSSSSQHAALHRTSCIVVLLCKLRPQVARVTNVSLVAAVTVLGAAAAIRLEWTMQRGGISTQNDRRIGCRALECAGRSLRCAEGQEKSNRKKQSTPVEISPSSSSHSESRG